MLIHRKPLGKQPFKSRKFTDEQLIELHSQGLTMRQMADKLGVTGPGVGKRMARLGLKPNGKQFDGSQARAWREAGRL